MSLLTGHWEPQLVSLAQKGIDSNSLPPASLSEYGDVLAQAYSHCDDLTSQNSRTFYMASALMPAEKRQAVRALYAFCRTTDDIVDKAESNPSAALASWRSRVFAAQPDRNDLVALAWADARARHQIPHLYAEQLLHGVERDLYQTRYETFADLTTYCYGVACTVGLMAMHITGFVSQDAIPYAIRLGVALQLTNILRDVGEDWRAGRLYLPQEELAVFGLDETDVANGVVDHRWRRFMRHQIDRTRHLYRKALPGVRLLSGDGRFAIAAAGELYQAILSDIEANDYDVFSRRASVSTIGKLSRLPGIWLRANLGMY